MGRLVQEQSAEPPRLLASLKALEEQAKAAGYLQLMVRIRLSSVYFLRQLGTAEAAAKADRLLAQLPPWIDDPAAAGWAAQVASERAALALARGDLRQAWHLFDLAQQNQRRTANFNHVTTVKWQAEILAQVGAAQEAVLRLGAALDDCRSTPCNPRLLPDAQSSFGWMTLLDSDASAQELQQGLEAVEAALQSVSREAGDTETANLWINLAGLRIRLDLDPAQALARARELLDSGAATGRTQLLSGWADLTQAQERLRQGDPAGAWNLCRPWTRQEISPRLAAWAWGCAGRALRRLGRPKLAAEALDQALILHEASSSDLLGQKIPLASGRRAEDYYEAARLAVDRDQPELAWELLSLLDRTSSGDRAAGGCTSAADTDREEQQRLLGQLAEMDRPAGLARRQQQEPMARSLKQRLQELWRQESGCSPPPPPRELLRGFRALALEDEVLLLERTETGRVRLARRTALDRREVRRRIAQAQTWMTGGRRTAEEWDRLLAPVAAAVLPANLDGLAQRSYFSLFGPLQELPLTALPLPSAPASDGGLASEALHLIDLTLPILVPAGGSRPAPRVRENAGHPLFVVDPRQDLGLAATVRDYLQAFPDAQILAGEAATHLAVSRALEAAAWLHLDAHGRYDPAFPELSSLLLADRPMTFVEWANLPIPPLLANLSGCQTGRWPTTADSGRYGFAGLLVQRGVHWVIASRADLDNQLARGFNDLFYRQLAADAEVPEAFREALRAVASETPVGLWAALMLLGDPTRDGGQWASLRTPQEVKEDNGPGRPRNQPPEPGISPLEEIP
jgi:hypothetical protein